MRVLFLGSEMSPTLAFLREFGEDVSVTSRVLAPATLASRPPEFLVSHGYRHIITPEVLGLFTDRVINLHISYLPWNRGADPNLWSWIDDTPKGVTIHYVDPRVDTGDIIAQREVLFDGTETLASSYARLQAEIVSLLAEQWPAIRTMRCDRRPQRGEGTSHRGADRRRVEHLLDAGWETPVARLPLTARGAAGEL
jgi:methionyl-tRNA formyltransferase